MDTTETQTPTPPDPARHVLVDEQPYLVASEPKIGPQTPHVAPAEEA